MCEYCKDKKIKKEQQDKYTRISWIKKENNKWYLCAYTTPTRDCEVVCIEIEYCPFCGTLLNAVSPSDYEETIAREG